AAPLWAPGGGGAGGEPVETLAPSRAHRDPHAGSGQHTRRRLADAGRGARDHGDPAGELLRHPGVLWEAGGYLPVTALTASCVTDTMRSSSASVMTIAGE